MPTELNCHCYALLREQQITKDSNGNPRGMVAQCLRCGWCWFESHSSHHVGTLGKSFTHSCLYDVMWPPAAKFDSYNSLLSSVHTLLVNILWCLHSFIHSFIVAISKAPLQVHYYSEALPRTRFEPFG